MYIPEDKLKHRRRIEINQKHRAKDKSKRSLRYWVKRIIKKYSRRKGRIRAEEFYGV